MRSLLLAGALALLPGECSSDPAPVLLDAAPTPDADNLTRCLIPADYGMLGTKTGTADLTTSNSLTIVLDPGPPKDDFFLKLVAGQGVFAGGIKTGTFTITGAEQNMATCGVCTNIIADIVAGQGPTKFYVADAGTVTLTKAIPTAGATPSSISGSAQNLHFVEIDINSGSPIAGGCVTTVPSITFGS